jgi:hypothetical protein
MLSFKSRRNRLSIVSVLFLAATTAWQPTAVVNRPKIVGVAHIAFEKDDARQLRDYLAARRVKVPGTLAPGADGNLGFTIAAPS